MKKESEDKMRVHVVDKIMRTKKQKKNEKNDIYMRISWW